MNKRIGINGKPYYTKTERYWGMWNMIRIVAQFTPTIKPSMLAPALTRAQAIGALKQLCKRGELELVRVGAGRWNNSREPVYRVKQ